MLRYCLGILCLFVLSACTPEPVLNLEELEANARGGDPQAIVQLVGLLSDEDEVTLSNINLRRDRGQNRTEEARKRSVDRRKRTVSLTQRSSLMYNAHF